MGKCEHVVEDVWLVVHEDVRRAIIGSGAEGATLFSPGFRTDHTSVN
jgi:hypothetical protein